MRLAKGEPLAHICRDDHMPDPSTVRDWQAAREEFSRAIARARVDGFDVIAADTLEIADDGRNDWMVRRGERVVDVEAVMRSKLRVETRLKLLAKWDPKRYGEAMTLKGDAENPLGPPVIVVTKKELPGASAGARDSLGAKSKAG